MILNFKKIDLFFLLSGLIILAIGLILTYRLGIEVAFPLASGIVLMMLILLVIQMIRSLHIVIEEQDYIVKQEISLVSSKEPQSKPALQQKVFPIPKQKRKGKIPEKNLNPVIVAGLGRCGTTLLFRALSDHGYTRNVDYLGDINGVETFENNVVYKTHDFPPANLPDHVKVIFLFGNVFNTIVSTDKMINLWGREHHMHLRSDAYVDNDIVFQKDSLGLATQFDAWYQQQDFPFISIRYEALYQEETLKQLRQFLGFDLKLPPYKERSTDWRVHPRKEELKEIYGGLQEQITRAEDWKVWK